MSTTSADGNVERIETLGAIAARQVIVNAPLETAIAVHGADHLVLSTTKVTPFGNYLLGWVEVPL